MPNRESLLAGRGTQPLDDHTILQVYNTFLSLENRLPVRYSPGSRTMFRVPAEGQGPGTFEIVYGEDIYPGRGVVDPNSSLSMQAAAAHEVTHYHRWLDHTELADDRLEHIDEALTSLESILRFPRVLSEHESRQLISDAIQRLQLFAAAFEAGRI